MSRPVPADLTVEAVEDAVPEGNLLGRPVQVFPIAVTAEQLALGLARQQEAPEGALVVVDLELAARARRGPPWTSVSGRSLAFAVLLRPDLPPEGEGLLWLLAGIAAAEGLERASGLEVALKWPDDLLVGDRRLGGVRADALLGPGRIETAVLTVRINVGLTAEDLPAAIRGTATSLAIEGAAASRTEVLAAVLERLEARYGDSVSDLLDAYRERCVTIGRSVRALLMPVGEAAGKAVDVDERGNLVIEAMGGRGTVSVGVLKRLEGG